MSKDASWHEFVTSVLGPPQKLDYHKETRRRSQRIVSAKIVPSDEQCRYLWNFHKFFKSNGGAAAQNDAMSENARKRARNTGKEDIVSTTKLSHEAITSLAPRKSVGASSASLESTRNALRREDILTIKEPVKIALSEQAQTSTISVKREETKHSEGTMSNNRVSLSPSRKRPRLAVAPRPSSPGWITKSNFYSHKSVWEVNDVDFLDAFGNDDSEDGSETKQVRARDADLAVEERQSKCDKNIDTKHPQCPQNKQEGSQDDLSIDLSSPDEKSFDEYRSNKRLFRPSASRANKRFKQRSILHLFGKK
jgi:hypothetical protein